jgi:hypothetical protein
MRHLVLGHTLFPIRNLQLTLRAVSSRNPVRMERRDETHVSTGVETTIRSKHPRIDKLQELVRSDSTGMDLQKFNVFSSFSLIFGLLILVRHFCSKDVNSLLYSLSLIHLCLMLCLHFYGS